MENEVVGITELVPIDSALSIGTSGLKRLEGILTVFAI